MCTHNLDKIYNPARVQIPYWVITPVEVWIVFSSTVPPNKLSNLIITTLPYDTITSKCITRHTLFILSFLPNIAKLKSPYLHLLPLPNMLISLSGSHVMLSCKTRKKRKQHGYSVIEQLQNLNLPIKLIITYPINFEQIYFYASYCLTKFAK